MLPIRAVLVPGLVLLCPALAVGQPPTITVGPNVNVSQRNGHESETAIAIDRVNTDRIVIASNWAAASNMFHAFTTDGGASWTTGSVGTTACCDPWLGADSHGNIYLSYLRNAGGSTVARSTNGGQSFTTLATVGTTTDHPEMSVGPGPLAGQQSVWISHRSSGQVRTFGATSTGLGSTSAFTAQQILTGSGSGNFGSIAVGEGGRVATTFMTPSTGVGPATLPIHYDPDGTATGSGFTQVNNSIVTQVGGFRLIPAQPQRSVDTQVELEYDFSGGPRNNTLYMIYTQAANPTTNDTNVVLRRSTDNGATWTNEVRIDDDAGTNSQFFSRVSVDQTTGYLAAVWYDARNSANNTRVELWGSVSTDGGDTWLPNFKISDGQWDGRFVNVGNVNEMGDYISMDYHNGRFVVAWADSSNSTGDNPNGTTNLDIYFAGVTVTPVPEPTAGLLLAAAAVGAWRRWRNRP